jgi:hypothetical protein
VAALALCGHRTAGAQTPVSFGLTPVFLDSDIQLLAGLEAYLSKLSSRNAVAGTA